MAIRITITMILIKTTIIAVIILPLFQPKIGTIPTMRPAVQVSVMAAMVVFGVQWRQ